MADDVMEQPVRVSLVLFPIHRKVLWDLRAGAGMVSSSSVLRSLIRQVSPEIVHAMQQHFAATRRVPGAFGRAARPSLLLDAIDLARLDELGMTAAAPSRSATARFLILNAADQRPATWMTSSAKAAA